MANDNISNLDDRRPHFNVMAICLACATKWIGTVAARTSLFALQCPNEACRKQNSFAAFIPNDYLEEHRE